MSIFENRKDLIYFGFLFDVIVKTVSITEVINLTIYFDVF